MHGLMDEWRANSGVGYVMDRMKIGKIQRNDNGPCFLPEQVGHWPHHYHWLEKERSHKCWAMV